MSTTDPSVRDDDHEPAALVAHPTAVVLDRTLVKMGAHPGVRLRVGHLGSLGGQDGLARVRRRSEDDVRIRARLVSRPNVL